MAPKGVKRTTTAAGAAASPKKSRKAEAPTFTSINETLQQADGMSARVQEMLVGFAGVCLSAPKSERHDVQQMGVRMIEETLEAHKNKLIGAVNAAKAELTKLEGSKSDLEKTLANNKAALESATAAHEAKNGAHVAAKEAVKAAQAALKEAKETQKKGDAEYANLEKEKAATEKANEEHFKAPMEANKGPHYKSLQKFISNLGLEDSLSSALPSSCAKAKEARGSFDDLVLTELGKALEGKIKSLGERIVNEASGVTDRKSAVDAAEATLEAKNSANQAAAAELEAAAAALKEAKAAEAKSTEEVATFEPRVAEASSNVNVQDTLRAEFEEGALKDFTDARDKDVEPVAAEEEEAAAPAAETTAE